MHVIKEVGKTFRGSTFGQFLAVIAVVILAIMVLFSIVGLASIGMQ